ncbi:MAG: DUF3098 domain-containing protein [Bacteroidales bacterium]|jgi:uncharacterized membrane protein|nr:DUF3098 domain-containing protein [Bacteroidales bacterium]
MANFSLPPKNVRFILIGLIVMVAGYILMIGGGSSDPQVFNYDMFDFRRLVLSPLLVILGIVIIIIAIMRRPKKDAEGEK